MFFIEKYRSSLTGNTLYSKKPLGIEFLDKALKETLEAGKFLKTIDVIKFKWMKEKNGIYWANGLRRLCPTPYKYTVPPLHFLKGTVAPKAAIRYEQKLVRKEEVLEVKEGLLF